MKFKILFPTGYQIDSIRNDNLDINVILPDNKVYFGSLFTIDNIKYLTEKNGQNYFWSTDMLIVADLKERTIYQIIEKIIDDGILANVFCEIGMLKDIYQEYQHFDDLPFNIWNFQKSNSTK